MEENTKGETWITKDLLEDSRVEAPDKSSVEDEEFTPKVRKPRRKKYFENGVGGAPPPVPPIPLPPKAAIFSDAEIADLFSPATWRGVVSAPANTMLAISGRKLWNLSDTEIDSLATPAAAAAKVFLQVDPKWVVLTLLMINVSTIYGARIVAHVREVNEEKNG